MHEYGLMENVIAVIMAELKKSGEEEARSGRLLTVTLKVGALELHSEEALRQAFEVLSQGTALEGARLHLVILPATLACPQCGLRTPCTLGSRRPP